jgi:hypothetical protein
VTDPLAIFYRHELAVERFLGDGAYGDQYAPSETITGCYSDGTTYSGGQIVSTGQFAFPLSYAYVPVQSRVTLPANFGGRVVTVKTSAVGDGGGAPTPDHHEIGVL